MENEIYRVVTQDSQGQLVTRDFESLDDIRALYMERGIDNCSMEKELRAMPLFAGLIGPMREGGVIRYESPAVFEQLTQQWYTAEPVPKGRKKNLP